MSRPSSSALLALLVGLLSLLAPADGGSKTPRATAAQLGHWETLPIAGMKRTMLSKDDVDREASKGRRAPHDHRQRHPADLRAAAAALPARHGRGAPCHLQSPRRCGPLLAPGETRPNATTVPESLVFINSSLPGATPLLVCVPAKAGTTSFFHWLYEALVGAPWSYEGKPWIHKIESRRWAKAPATLVHFSTLDDTERARLLADRRVPRVAVTRHPLERALSAYYSKVGCGTGDTNSHANYIEKLLHQAPLAAVDIAVDHFYQAGKNETTACIAAADWAKCLLEARLSGGTPSPDATRAFIPKFGSGEVELMTNLMTKHHRNRWFQRPNIHFESQVDACGFRDIGYDMLLPLEHAADGGVERFVGEALGRLPGGAVPHRQKTHGSGKFGDRKIPFSEAELALVARVYEEDLELLHYPP